MHFMRSQVCLRFSGVLRVPGVLRWMERMSLRKAKVKRKGIVADEQLECGKLFCSMGSSVVERLHVRVRGEPSKHDTCCGSVLQTLNVREEVDSIPYTESLYYRVYFS